MTAVVGRRILRFARVTSTMDVAAELAAAGEPEGLVVVADEQTAGRGRAGRSWIAPPGSSLLLTALLRPAVSPERLGVLAPLAGIALAEAVGAETGLQGWLKWPNDLWLGDRNAGSKAAGVLATTRVAGGRAEHVLLGIGLNVATPPAALPPRAISLVAALDRGPELLHGGHAEGSTGHDAAGAIPLAPDAIGRPPDREKLLAAILARLDDRYADFLATGGRPSLDGWLARAALLGEPVSVEAGGETVRGVHAGIDDDGALLLRRPDGLLGRVVAGDLTRGPRRATEGAEG